MPLSLAACRHCMCVAVTAYGYVLRGMGRFSLVASKIGQGDKALLDMTTAEPISNEELEEAIVESFLDGHEGLAFSEVQWTGIDDVSLLFQDDMEFDDNSSKALSTSGGYTSNSCSMSVYSPSDTCASDNTSPPSPQHPSACEGAAGVLPPAMHVCKPGPSVALHPVGGDQQQAHGDDEAKGRE